MFRFKNDCLVTIRNLLCIVKVYTLTLSIACKDSNHLQCQNILRGVCRYAYRYFLYGECGGNANAAVRRYANACVMTNEGYFEHLL
jgi:hypothetical protein